MTSNCIPESNHRISAIPPAHQRLFALVAGLAKQANADAYVVGGYVRDLILGRGVNDFDIVIAGAGTALDVAVLAEQAFGGRVVLHKRFKTAVWHLDPEAIPNVLGRAQAGQAGAERDTVSGLPDTVDLITARREAYARPGALPDVEQGTLRDDVFRRDFTINTLALHLESGVIIDLSGGLNDLAARKIRTLHSASFRDDPTRIFRAVRFEQRLGFQIAGETEEDIRRHLGFLSALTPARLRHEFDLIFSEPRAAEMLARLSDLGVLRALFGERAASRVAVGTPSYRRLRQAPYVHALLAGEPDDVGIGASPASRELRAGQGAARRNTSQKAENLGGEVWRHDPSTHFAVGLALWLLDSEADARMVLSALAPKKALTNIVMGAVKLYQVVEDTGRSKKAKWSDGELAEILDAYPPESVAVVAAAVNGEVAHRLAAYLHLWRHVRPALNGNDLRAMGIPPGPIYKKILDGLRRAIIDGEVVRASDEHQWVRARV